MNYNSRIELDVQGHRGCRGLLPENTLPAFEKAIDLGVHTLELDIAITKDRKVVVSHEPFMSRTICLDPEGKEIRKSMDMKHNLYEMLHEDIRLFDCGSKDHPHYPNQSKLKTYKPLLAEVFELVKSKNSKVKFNIEFKSKPEYYGVYTPYPKDYVTLVLDEIKTSGFFNSVNLQSFDLAILEEIKKQDEKMCIALLIDGDEVISEKLKKLSFNPEIISPYYKLIFRQLVEEYQSKGYQIIPWTVNAENDMKKMVTWQVDGVITDYPNRLFEVLSK